jgi:DHA2 family multidrug resistance protein
MEVLDTSIANVALPHMAGSLGASQEEATWVLTSYLVASAIVLPISGWLSNRFGRKRFYMTCVAMFTVCSMLCGFAQTCPADLARVLQGLGGGGLAPSEQAILADTFPSKRGQAFALYGMAVVVAPAIGPTLGGWITDNFNWHWIFFINSRSACSRSISEQPHGRGPAVPQSAQGSAKHLKVDFTGLGLVASASAPGVHARQGPGEGLVRRPDDRPSRILIAVCLLIFFVFWEWNHPDPIVDLKLLKNRNFGTAVFLQLILGMVLFGSTVLIPQYLQVLLGYTAERAGMVLSPAGFVMMVMMFGRRPHCRQDGPAADGLPRLLRHRRRHLQPHAARPHHQLRHRHRLAHAAGDRPAVHLHPHQHAELRRRPATRATRSPASRTSPATSAAARAPRC